MENKTIGSFLYDCLSNEGITDIFGVPGDYNFSLLNALEEYGSIKFVNCCNELNAGYAADAYARVKGISALITTFGVGELSTCNAIAGSYCESVPVIHIIGGPKTAVQQEHKQMHHTLLNGDFEVFKNLYGFISQYTAKITPENAAVEIPTAIAAAKESKKPVYLLIASDIVNKPVVQRDVNISKKQTSQPSLQAAVQHISSTMDQSQNPVLLSGIHVSRYNLQARVQQLAEKINLPVATMMMGKGSFDERHKNFIGLYAGSLGNTQVQNIVETSDCVLAVGTNWSDYNTGIFTARINPVKLIDIQPNKVSVGMTVYENVLIQDILSELPGRINKQMPSIPQVNFSYENDYPYMEEPVTARYYYPRIQKMLRENDILVADAGSFQFGSALFKLPRGATYITQGGWGSIGYGTPATFGACMADKNRRVILFVGDGSNQMTVQEFSSMLVNKCKPIIFLVNNSEYTIEKYLNAAPKPAPYNNIASWDYAKLLEAFGGDFFSAKVHTNKELDAAIKQAETLCSQKLCLIELFAPQMDAPEIVHKMKSVVEQMAKQM
ncbi:alpha-keto acid decarboxylase family protein [Ruminiclostridium cellobioparum]|uniref:Alpha-keto-acid decarboxylase n=1 Tax=Ruminiclostridium cellobioparum subsp. termitidis CT1112 TaxID=1195236 RepID=S0FIF9_RUMCE|nr:thiamine pyrophosphate-binding protein [Ruminiclostridium cellobioparum]EMS69891.1 thiamine pyrophosphate binding domain-containing protein [Ruminiclostridium cellobioparum subsp. termitidis CT1112]